MGPVWLAGGAVVGSTGLCGSMGVEGHFSLRTPLCWLALPFMI